MSINYKKTKILKVKFLSLIKDFLHLEVKMNSHCPEKILLHSNKLKLQIMNKIRQIHYK